MRATGFVVYAVAVTLLPALVVAWSMGAMAPFWFLAGDAYLYLGIGQASHGISMSFDGLRATNGFHPLWQVWVRLATALSGGDALRAMTLVSYSAILCTAAGVIALGLAIRRATGTWLLAMLAVPGVYYLVIGQALRNLPVWAFFDGMEAGLAFLLSGLVLGLIARGAAAPVLGFVLALLVLTRLDEVFVPAAMAVAVWAWPGRTAPPGDRWRDAAWLLAPTALAVGVFALWSLATTGMLAPVSGAAKGEGALLQNGWVTLATFVAPLIDLREALTGYTADRAGLAGGAFRVVELIVPALFAAGLLAAVWRRFRAEPWAPFLAGVCVGVLIKAAYTLTSVNYWHQATWYFAMATALMSFGTALLLAPAARRLSPRGAGLAALVLGTLSLLHASLWSAALITDPLRPQQRDFWLARDTLEARLHAVAPDARVIEFGDGLLNFTLSDPVRHGFVFAGDAQSLDALRNHRLLADAVADGFTLLSSYEYLRVPPGAEAWDSARIRSFLMDSFLDQRVKDELGDFDFAMAYVARPWGVPFIRLIPRG
ncbi:MAG: hypothetical protein H6899_03210 [Rhodobacter sp.]|nr:hypothetical protein [Rhodobacter sp.]